MDHAFGMRRVQRAPDLAHNLHCARQRKRPFLPNQIFQGPAIQEFHDEKNNAAFILAKVGHTQSMGMGNPRRCARLAREARDNLLVSSQRRTQDLDCYSLAHEDVRPAIDGAHATHTEAFLDTIFSR